MSDMGQVLQAVLELSKKMDKLEESMDSLEVRMGSMESRMESLESRMVEHEEKTDKHNQILLEKLDSINEQIGILAHASVATNGDIRVLKKKVGLLDY